MIFCKGRKDDILNEKNKESKYMTSFVKHKLMIGLMSVGIILALFAVAYAASVLDGDVEIVVPDYDSAAGWSAGVIYDAKIVANFADATSNSKRVTITLPEGMRFVAYPVIGTPAVGSPGYQIDTGSVLGQFITSVSIPQKQTYYPSYNGSLTYELTSACESVEIPFKVTVDENVYYAPKNITDGIRSIANKNGSSIGDAHMHVNAVGTASMTWHTATWVDPTPILAGSSDAVLLPQFSVQRTSFLATRPCYVKQVEEYYYYPKEVNIASASTPDAVVETNTTEGYILSRWQNQFSHGWRGQRPSVSVLNTPIGLYASADTIKMNLTMYDNTVIPINLPYRVRVDVVATADNKLGLTAIDAGYYEYTDDYYVSGPRFGILSNLTNVKERQYVEYTIDPNYEVIEARFPKDPIIGTIGEVQYKTNLSSSIRIATSAQITIRNTNSFAISAHSLSLAENEYITYARASIGSVSPGFESSPASARWTLSPTARIVGKLKDGITTAPVTIRTFALLPGGNIEQNSENIISRTVTRIVNPTASLKANSNAITMHAGNTQKISFSLTGSGYYYSDSVGLSNPTAYIRIPPNTQINSSTITAKSNIEGDLPFSVTGPYVSAVSGETFVKVVIVGKVGSLFDLQIDHMITLSFDFTVGLAAGGSYDWSKYVFWRDDIGNAYTSSYGYPAIISDTLDVDNDGNIAEKLVPAYSNVLSIIPKEEIIIDTYIVPEGESRKPAYDGTVATAVAFTPGTTAKYTVEILNNRTETASEIRAYVPVPKETLNFGTQFQNNAFAWNMKLRGTPSVRVYDRDGVDITATAGSHYVLAYSSDATTEQNYATATYGTTFGDDTTMIRLINTSTIAAYENAIIEFDYVVDETINPVAIDPTKLGAVNDFRPYYYFDAGTAGWQNGTRVGAILQIGKIAGRVFFDQDKNGIYEENADIPIANKVVDVYKKNIDDTYTFLTNATTYDDGTYALAGVSNGVYRVDFNAAASANQEFTLKDRGANDTIDSDVAHIGAMRGFAENVDPTSSMSEYVSAGIIDYDAQEDLIVTVNKSTTNIKMTNAQTIFTEQLVGTIFPDYFDAIKATNGITWISSNPAIVSVSNGLIQGARVGSAEISYVATDVYGHTKDAKCMVTVTSNDVPIIQEIDTEIAVGTHFDPLEHISVTDTEDGDITARVVVENNTVQEKRAGTYAVNYTIEDTDGNIANKTISITYVPVVPQVTTLQPSNVTEKSATLNSSIITAGGTEGERMIEWGTTSGNYTHSCNAGVGSEGSYSCDVKNLSPNTVYYYRAHVDNDAGSGYGEEMQFSTHVSADTSVTAVQMRGHLRMGGNVIMGSDE